MMPFEVVNATNNSEPKNLPSDAVIIGEHEEDFMYTLNENTRALYKGNFKAQVYYSKLFGVGIDYSFDCGACKISSVTGTATIRDYWDYEYLEIPANSYGYGYNRVSFYKNTGKTFPTGISQLYVDYYLYVSLLNGDILNGNRIIYSVGPMTIPKH